MQVIKCCDRLLPEFWLVKHHVILVGLQWGCYHHSQWGHREFLPCFRCFLNTQQLKRLSKTIGITNPTTRKKKKKTAIETKSAVPVSRPISTLNCDRISPSHLSLLWLDLCCLDTVHTAVRLGHSQAREESGVNGTRKTLFPKMYLFLNNLKWKEGFFALLMMRLEGVGNPKNCLQHIWESREI